MSPESTEEGHIAQWLAEEAKTQAASEASPDLVEQDEHYLRAERYADCAWSLAETNNHAFIASSIWRGGL
jgi:hypothetical protein